MLEIVEELSSVLIRHGRQHSGGSKGAQKVEETRRELQDAGNAGKGVGENRQVDGRLPEADGMAVPSSSKKARTSNWQMRRRTPGARRIVMLPEASRSEPEWSRDERGAIAGNCQLAVCELEQRRGGAPPAEEAVERERVRPAPKARRRRRASEVV